MKPNTHDELITGSLLRQSVTERLDIPTEQSRIELDDELLELIFDLYDDDRDFPYQKIRKFSIGEILTYLQGPRHRYYLTKKLPEIEQSLLHIFSRYGKTHELLAELCLFFNDYKTDLIEHVKMEEREFFPLHQATRQGRAERTDQLTKSPNYSALPPSPSSPTTTTPSRTN